MIANERQEFVRFFIGGKERIASEGDILHFRPLLAWSQHVDQGSF